MGKSSWKGPVHSVGKAMELLEILFSWNCPMALQQIADAVGCPKSTVHALLSTLREYGMIAQEPGGRYTLGARLYEYGCAVASSWDASVIAHPHLEQLAHKTNSSAFISLLEGNYVISFQQVTPNSGSGYQVSPETGKRLPLHATAQGKLLMSMCSESTIEQFVQESGLTPYTPHTITDYSALCSALQKIRANGYAVEDGEYKIGLRAVAAPVYDHTGTVKYALGTVGLFRRTSSEEFQRVIELTVAQAKQMSLDLSGRTF